MLEPCVQPFVRIRAVAGQGKAQADLEEAKATSRDGSVGRLTDVQRSGGTSTIAHPTLRGQGLSIEASRHAVEATQELARPT